MHEEIISHSANFDSPIILALAKEAAARCSDEANPSTDAIAAVVLSFTSFEAFINELTQFSTVAAEHWTEMMVSCLPEEDVSHETVAKLAFALDVAERCRMSLLDRYDLAWKTISGEEIDKGSPTRQSLHYLSLVRNGITHLKSMRVNSVSIWREEDAAKYDGIWLGHFTDKYYDPPKFTKDLDTRGLLIGDKDFTPWLHRISNSAMAHWACETVESSARKLVALLPEPCRFRQRIAMESIATEI